MPRLKRTSKMLSAAVFTETDSVVQSRQSRVLKASFPFSMTGEPLICHASPRFCYLSLFQCAQIGPHQTESRTLWTISVPLIRHCTAQRNQIKAQTVLRRAASSRSMKVMLCCPALPPCPHAGPVAPSLYLPSLAAEAAGTRFKCSLHAVPTPHNSLIWCLHTIIYLVTPFPMPAPW